MEVDAHHARITGIVVGISAGATEWSALTDTVLVVLLIFAMGAGTSKRFRSRLDQLDLVNDGLLESTASRIIVTDTVGHILGSQSSATTIVVANNVAVLIHVVVVGVLGEWHASNKVVALKKCVVLITWNWPERDGTWMSRDIHHVVDRAGRSVSLNAKNVELVASLVRGHDKGFIRSLVECAGGTTVLCDKLGIDGIAHIHLQSSSASRTLNVEVLVEIRVRNRMSSTAHGCIHIPAEIIRANLFLQDHINDE